MRYIRKRAEPSKLTAFKALANDDWKPTYCNLKTDVKKTIIDSLLDEQYYICCYCESELKEDDCHIEHVIPRHVEGVYDLDYSNLACSCVKCFERKIPMHCGHAKNNALISVTPYDEGCENRFFYRADGYIYAKDDDEDAKNTINILNLNIPKLKDLRAKVLSVYINYSEDDHSVKSIMEEDMKPINGKLPPYVSMIEYYYNSGLF